MSNTLRLADARNVGCVFATGDDLPAPWDTLPAYWEAEANAFAAYPAAPIPTVTRTAPPRRLSERKQRSAWIAKSRPR